MRNSRLDANHGNVSVPRELVDFMDKWLETREAEDLGVKSRRDFVITVFEIQLKKLKKFQAESFENPSGPLPGVTIPRGLSDELDRIARGSYVTKALWLPCKTDMLSFALQRILTEKNKKYNMLAELLTITLNDIRDYKEKEKKLAGSREARQF